MSSTSTRLSAKTLIDSALPQLIDNTLNNPSQSNAALRRVPRDVRRWDLQADVQLHYDNIQSDLESQTQDFEPMRKSAEQEDGIYRPGDERDIETYFLQTAGASLNKLFEYQIVMSSFRQSGIDIGQGLRTPDVRSRMIVAITSSSSSSSSSSTSSTSTSTSNDIPLVLGEVKRCSLYVNGTNLVTRYSHDRHVEDAIQQLTGYHVFYGCKYGFITTYIMTWASYLSPTGILYISSPYMSTSTGVCSVRTLLHYVISAARSEVEEGKPAWKLPKPHQLPDPENDDGGDQSAHKLSGSKASSKRRQGASSSNKHRRKTRDVMIKTKTHNQQKLIQRRRQSIQPMKSTKKGCQSSYFTS
jgi:hypothetical protein